MWLLHVLAEHLRWYGLLEVGMSMLDGSYYRETSIDASFGIGVQPAGDFGGCDG